jgi:hypothetical protein
MARRKRVNRTTTEYRPGSDWVEWACVFLIVGGAAFILFLMLALYGVF